MYSDGSKHSSFSVPNNRNGAKIIVDRVTSVLLLQDIPQVVIGMEATSVYGDNLMRFLRESGSLGRFERSLHMLNPKQVKKFRDAYSDLPKNDHVDSYVIADHLRFGRINKEVYMDDYKYQALKMYTQSASPARTGTDTGKAAFSEHCFHKFFRTDTGEDLLQQIRRNVNGSDRGVFFAR